jgi:hypothetical protein
MELGIGRRRIAIEQQLALQLYEMEEEEVRKIKCEAEYNAYESRWKKKIRKKKRWKHTPVQHLTRP